MVKSIRDLRRWTGVVAAAAVALASGVAAADPARDAADAWRTAHEKAILGEFTDFLSLPDVATSQADIEANATHLEAMLRARGFETRRLSAGPGTPPTVFAEMKVTGAKRTVLYYAHYDGQPIGQAGWLSSPFQPVMRTGALKDHPTVVDWRAAAKIDPEWRIYARGSGDDRATIEALLTAIDALKAKGLKPSVNVKLFYEGEEEQGSPHLAQIVSANRDLLKADLVIMGDGPMHQSGRQQVNFGSRGVAGFTATVYGPLRPLHDGHYGSWAPSPAVEIAQLVASLRKDNGDIEIPGIYDNVRPPSATERAALAALPPVEDDLAHSLGIQPITNERLDDSYFRPTLNVRAIHVGDTGPNAANAIATTASASFDFRLVPGQTPERVQGLVRAYLEQQGWLVTDQPPDMATRLAHAKIVKITWDPGASVAVKTDMDAPAAKAAVSAIERVEGAPILRVPMVGASSGIAVIVTDLDAPMAGVSIANYDDNQHAENENLRLANLWDGIAVYAGLLSELTW
ncbi:MAG TPA: M20/M25/M40 family metallo-hydrolase [Caulobacteraceae bacterium]|jgi:acetylornithine deacetylase/succinyl-diaminopimelate desuccinylase-like protein